MKRDIDTLLTERGLAAAVIVKLEHPSATFRYVAGPPAQHMTVGMLVLRPGKKPHLLHSGMERDAAVQTPFERSEYGDWGYAKIREREGTLVGATARLLQTLLQHLGVSGDVLFSGILDVGQGYHLLERLREYHPGIRVAADTDPGLFALARLTKDADEVAAMRAAGDVCARAYARIAEVIRGGRLEGTRLKDAEGWVTVGRLRRETRRVFFDAGLEEPHGNIVAMGRDAGVPHNVGNDADVLEEGKPIVIDLFPVEAGGGYYHDVTRTICVGRAPAELKELHGLVREAVNRTVESLHVGASGRTYQELVCDLFEAKGHRTIRQDERLEEGYVHGLGHGIGLEVHERPNLTGSASNQDRIEPGSVFTVEPGLYYPSRGLGVRIEDVVHAKPDGTIETLTNVPYELEIAPA